MLVSRKDARSDHKTWKQTLGLIGDPTYWNRGLSTHSKGQETGRPTENQIQDPGNKPARLHMIGFN